MFKISDEFKAIPHWFIDFEPKKLIDHPVRPIKYQIWLIQLGAALSVVISLVLSVITLNTGLGGFALIGALFGASFAQVLILGIHARSRLAWLLLASNAIRFTFSALFLIGFGMFYLIDQDESVAYFKNEPLPANPQPTTVTA
jgi:hypothetical protein